MDKRFYTLFLLFVVAFTICVGADTQSKSTLTGRQSYTIAAKNTPNFMKSQADICCDGATDTQTIQGAINSLSVSGGTIYLMQGDYFFTSLSVPYNNISLTGSGMSTVMHKIGSGNGLVIGTHDKQVMCDTVQKIYFTGSGISGDGALVFIDNTYGTMLS